MTTKGTIVLVHIYPREMSIYGDLGNTRVMQQRLTWHGYTCDLRRHHPGEEFPRDAHLVLDEWCDRVGRDPLAIERSAGVAYTPALLPEDATLDFAGQAQALFEVGTRLFTISLTTPPYDLGPIREVLAWRDAVNASRAAEQGSPTSLPV